MKKTLTLRESGALEFVVEATKLLAISLEGSVG